MFNLAYCFLAILIFLSTTMECMSERPKNINEQCRARGDVNVKAACSEGNLVSGEVRCLFIDCATQHPKLRKTYVVHRIHGVDDGTICAPNKVCEKGACVPSPGAQMVAPFYEPGKLYCHQDKRKKP